MTKKLHGRIHKMSKMSSTPSPIELVLIPRIYPGLVLALPCQLDIIEYHMSYIHVVE